jgi:tetratricopeptide (TPR) repeat protein
MIAANFSGAQPRGLMKIVFLALFGMTLVPAFSQNNNATDMGCSGTVANPCGKSSGSGSRSSPAPVYRDTAAEEAAARRNAAHNLNESGVKVFERGDYAEALELFKQAAKLAPDNQRIKQNVENAQSMLDQQIRLQKEAEEAAKRNKAAATSMQQSANALANSLTVSAADGLDFESDINRVKAPDLDFTNNSSSPCHSGASGLTFGDTRTVDVRCVPSGLGKFIDDSIGKEFAKSPPGVSDRVRKGFQSLMTQDRSVALSWFKQALSLDPNNEGLKRLIELTDYTLNYQSRPKVINQSNQLILPQDNGAMLIPVILHLTEPQGPKNQAPQKGNEELMLTPTKESKNLQLPQRDDIALLFLENNQMPTIYSVFKDGTFHKFTPSPGGTVFFANGPYTVLANGGFEPSTDPKDIKDWEKYFKNSPSQLVAPANGTEYQLPQITPPPNATKKP